MITNKQSGTQIDEIASGIYRISTPFRGFPGGFSFNQYLIVDDEPLLFHTGLRRMFPLLKEAVSAVMPFDRLRHVSFAHFEADECGALNDILAHAPHAAPLCSNLAAMVSINDVADRPARTLEDGAVVQLGKHQVKWLAAPHMPHAWENGFLFEETTRTLLCGDLFTQPGADNAPLTEGDILGPSEAFRGQADYYAHSKDTGALLEKLIATNPQTLACMHGSAWRGDGASLLRELGKRLGAL
jgi:flavorubredoxin